MGARRLRSTCSIFVLSATVSALSFLALPILVLSVVLLRHAQDVVLRKLPDQLWMVPIDVSLDSSQKLLIGVAMDHFAAFAVD